MADYPALAAELAKPAYAGLDDGRATDLVNAQTATTQVPRTLSLLDLAAPESGFNPASVLAVFRDIRYPEFQRVIDTQNIPGAIAQATLFAAAGVISAADLAAFEAYCGGTVSVTVSLPDALGFGPACSVEQVAHARRLD